MVSTKMVKPKKIRKIDARNALSGLMKYQIKLHYREAEQFWIWVDWCCSTWHSPVEYRSMSICGTKLNKTQWSFRCPSDLRDNFELYLHSDEELGLFTLKWL